MTAKKAKKPKIKFEEDIKAPFKKPSISSLFSFSSKRKADKEPKKMADVVNWYPDLFNHLEPYEPEQKVGVVGKFTARELVLDGGYFRVGDKRAECGLVVWYEAKKDAKAPVAVEFSFRYQSASEEYSLSTTRAAFDAFRVLQSEVAQAWIDVNPATDAPTKTALAYRRAKCLSLP